LRIVVAIVVPPFDLGLAWCGLRVRDPAAKPQVVSPYSRSLCEEVVCQSLGVGLAAELVAMVACELSEHVVGEHVLLLSGVDGKVT
jgi:hypothetical protein